VRVKRLFVLLGLPLLLNNSFPVSPIININDLL